jgi:hypothetical protein
MKPFQSRPRSQHAFCFLWRWLQNPLYIIIWQLHALIAKGHVETRNCMNHVSRYWRCNIAWMRHKYVKCKILYSSFWFDNNPMKIYKYKRFKN